MCRDKLRIARDRERGGRTKGRRRSTRQQLLVVVELQLQWKLIREP